MTRGTVLLVEDDRDIRETLQDALEEEGYVVVGAFDGLDALEHLRADPALPDLILLDLMMPRMTGEEFRAEMSKVGEWAAIPVVILSADAQVHAKAASLNAAAVLQKPVTLRALFDTVTQALAG